MKLRYFSKASAIGPSSRYRIYQYVPYFNADGIETEIYPLFGPLYFRLLEWRTRLAQLVGKAVYAILRFLKRLFDLLSIGSADLVVIEGQLFPYCPSVVERVLARRHRFVLELDDAIYLTPWHERKIRALLRMSAGAIVGNATLAQYASAYARNVHVVPTVVDTDRFSPQGSQGLLRKPCLAQEITIVWIGLACNFPYIENLRPVFLRMQEEYRIILRVVSSQPPVLPGVMMEFRPWSYETEVQDLQTGDIGVMPLIDDEWGRGKCGLKLLQYMAVGMPAVASPVGVNREIIRDGDNGFLATTEDDWYAKLTILCRNAQLCEKIGAKARQTVVDHYSLSVWAPRLAACYRTIVANAAEGECSSQRGFNSKPKEVLPHQQIAIETISKSNSVGR
jgi:glycosyltransferase involved in cell wall biosynthesis